MDAQRIRPQADACIWYCSAERTRRDACCLLLECVFGIATFARVKQVNSRREPVPGDSTLRAFHGYMLPSAILMCMCAGYVRGTGSISEGACARVPTDSVCLCQAGGCVLGDTCGMLYRAGGCVLGDTCREDGLTVRTLAWVGRQADSPRDGTHTRRDVWVATWGRTTWVTCRRLPLHALVFGRVWVSCVSLC